MKRLLSAGAVSAAVLLLAATSASAQTVTMVATLNSGEETPPFLNGAAGSAVITIDSSPSASKDIRVVLNIFNLPNATTVGHIHVGPRGIAGPVVIDFPIPPGQTGDLALNFTVGAAQFRPSAVNGILTYDDALQSILLGNAYVNIHTSANPAGEIRGQLSIRP